MWQVAQEVPLRTANRGSAWAPVLASNTANTMSIKLVIYFTVTMALRITVLWLEQW